MKAVSKFVNLLSLGMLTSIAVSAMTPEQFYIETSRQDTAIPVPISVVTPRVGTRYEGTMVELEFVVDATGKPADIVVKSAMDFTVGALVTDAIKQWRFKPAESNGVPVPMKVVLPVRILEDRPTADNLVARK